MQTPYLPQKLFAEDFKKVYEPAEDSFLLLDALEQDLDSLRHNVNICLECGSGSGIIVTALAQALNKKNITAHETLPHVDCLLFATDLSWDACLTTKKCATHHDLASNLQTVRANLAGPLVDRLENSVDLLIFNPPYVPTTELELVGGLSRGQQGRTDSSGDQLHRSWAGGANGRELIDLFLGTYVPRLLSKPNGTAYMVALKGNNLEDLVNFLVDKHKIKGTIVLERKTGIEYLYVVKYEWLRRNTSVNS